MSQYDKNEALTTEINVLQKTWQKSIDDVDVETKKKTAAYQADFDKKFKARSQELVKVSTHFINYVSLQTF
jgi:hypothetical protein